VVARSVSCVGISVSVIIPVYNETAHLEKSLRGLFASLDNDSVEVIVCDGGSTDNSVQIARHFPCQIVTSQPGRAQQMNTASQLAQGDWILFLHADSQLPEHWTDQLHKDQHWGFFPVQLSGDRWFFRIIENFINLRSRYSQVATGDQALFFRRSFFSSLQGFPLIPIMEDIAISKKARHLHKPRVATHPVVTSSRRWEQNGIIKTIVLMWSLRLAYWLGINPSRLQRIYYPKQHL
jgi:rSAM/selenodomain-associated transferase 2